MSRKRESLIWKREFAGWYVAYPTRRNIGFEIHADGAEWILFSLFPREICRRKTLREAKEAAEAVLARFLKEAE